MDSKQTELVEQIIRLINVYGQQSKKPREYKNGIVLYPSEAHLIEAIANHRGANASELSNRLGITNGAVNQVATKLIKKGLIDAYHLNSNQKEIFYQLTPLGEMANKEHNEFHARIYQSMNKEMKTEHLEIIRNFLDELTQSISCSK